VSVRAACAVVAALLAAASRVQPAARGAVLDAIDLRGRAAHQVTLPHALREISGLAVTDDGRVLAHGDERGVIYELDYRRGTVVKAFFLGPRPIPGDFEGIAVVGARVFLMTSTGLLYETREGPDGASVPYAQYDTGFGTLCELEGLAYDPTDHTLVIPCKRPRQHAMRGSVVLFRWNVDQKRAVASRVTIPLAALTRGAGGHAFEPSAVERDPRTGHYVVVAGPQQAVVEVTRDGAVVAARPLPKGTHRQPEGITFLGDSVVLLADEGGDRRGTLTWYARAR
jgi:uncharacterized protein YjiK